MKKVISALALVVLTAAITVMVMYWSRPQTASHGFVANDFLTVTLEYAGPRDLIGVDTFGPSPKAFACERGAAAAVAQAHEVLPPGHTLSATCLHVSFKGPLGPDGAIVVQPFHGKPLEVVAIGVEFTHAGKFYGAEPLHKAPDVGTCARESREVIKENRREGRIPAGNSLVIYCLPVPVMHKDGHEQDGTV